MNTQTYNLKRILSLITNLLLIRMNKCFANVNRARVHVIGATEESGLMIGTNRILRSFILGGSVFNSINSVKFGYKLYYLLECV